MLTTKPTQTPMVATPTLSLSLGTLLKDSFEYRSTIGALQYLLLAILDFAFAITKHVSSFTPQLMSTRKLLRGFYDINLCSTLDLSLTFSPSSTPTLNAYLDADWAGYVDDKKNTSVFVVFYGSNLISWASWK